MLRDLLRRVLWVRELYLISSSAPMLIFDKDHNHVVAVECSKDGALYLGYLCLQETKEDCTTTTVLEVIASIPVHVY